VETTDLLYFRVLKILRRMWLRKPALAGDEAENNKRVVKRIAARIANIVFANVAIGVEKRVVYICVVNLLRWHRQHRAVFMANAHRGGRTFRGVVAQVIVSMVIELVKDERLPRRPRPD
jgi:hypothetical protein